MVPSRCPILSRLALVTACFVAFSAAAVACGGDDSSPSAADSGTSSGNDGGGTTDSGAADTSTGNDGAAATDGSHEGGVDRDAAVDSGAKEGEYTGPCMTATEDTQGDCQPGYVCHLYRGRMEHACTVSCADGGTCPAPSPKCGGDSYCALP